MKNFNKGFVVPAVIAVIATLIIGSGIYVYEKNKQPSPAGQSGTPDTSLANTNGWKTYNNAAYNYSIKYPANWYINTTYSNQDFTPRGPSPSTYIGGDTSISNYSDTYMDEYHAKNGDLAQPADYFLISLSFTKIEVTNNGSMGTYKENADPYAFLGNYLSKFGKPNTTDNIMLNGTSAVRNTYLNITGIGGNTKPNRVSVNLRRGNEIIGIGYGFDDSVKSLVPIADQIVNSLTLGNNAQASGVLFSASPTSGVAPLTVTFTGTIDTKIYGNGPFTVDFGDGQQKSFPILGLVNEARSDVASIQPTTHIYNNPGNYVAKLAKNNCSLPTSGRLQQPTCKPGDMINTANINVGKNNSVTPSVTVSSPNGGEDWSVGSTNAISWSSNAGNLVSPNVVLSLSDSSGHNILQIAPSVPLTGSYEWSIPSSVVPGQYKVSAYLSGVGARGGGAVQDYSDSYFTISPTVSASPNPASSRGITINSISQPSGQVGTQLKLNVSFSNEIYRGPEYATQVVLKRSSGETAIVDTMADFNTVTFSIQNNMCGVSLGGRGGQCPSDKIVMMYPGSYTIYFENTYFQPNIISNGVQFTLTGTPISTGTVTPSPSVTTSPSPVVTSTNQSTMGNQRILVLLVNYLDSGTPPVTKSWLQDRIFNGPFEKFYDETSYHQISFTGNVSDWITLNKNDDNHSDAVCIVSSSLLWSAQPQPEIINYLKQNNIDLSNYDGLYLIVNTPNTGPCSQGIKRNLTIDGKTYNLFVSEIPISNSSEIQQTSAPYPMTSFEASMIHETGHDFGLAHANGWDCNDKIISGNCQAYEYGGLFDVMGTAHDAFQFGAYFKDLLGWIKPERKMVITKSGTYTINPLEADTGIATAIIQPTGISFPLYYLEFRRPIGFDSYIDRYPYNERGLVVTWPQRDKSYRLLNMVPVAHVNSNGTYGNAWVYDLAGIHSTLNAAADNPNPSAFYDQASGVTIGPVTSVDANSITFQVTMP